MEVAEIEQTIEGMVTLPVAARLEKPHVSSEKHLDDNHRRHQCHTLRNCQNVGSIFFWNSYNSTLHARTENLQDSGILRWDIKTILSHLFIISILLLTYNLCLF